jgi:hypothetical protein
MCASARVGLAGPDAEGIRTGQMALSSNRKTMEVDQEFDVLEESVVEGEPMNTTTPQRAPWS